MHVEGEVQGLNRGQRRDVRWDGDERGEDDELRPKQLQTRVQRDEEAEVAFVICVCDS